MTNCNTNCVEKPLSKVFSKFGRIVGKYPWVFLISPLIISTGLGTGFYFLKDRESNGIEDQFTPKNGQAKTERAVIQQYFPQGEEFSSLRLSTDGTFASVIAVNETNILSEEALQDLINLDKKIKEIQVAGGHLTYSDLCAKESGMCVSNPILDIVRDSFHKGIPINYPLHKINGRDIFIGNAIGGVSHQSNTIKTAQAIRLFYYLTDDRKNDTDLWLKMFIKTLSGNTEKQKISVSFFTSISREEEFDKNSKTVIPLFSVTYFLGITISVVSCLRLDCVRNKIWVAMFGVLAAGLAVLTSFGLLLFCGIPFVMTVATAPFLILGIGVDDMFIMISCWQTTKVKAKVEDRMAETYKEAAVSITITTLTDVLAFYIGLMTPFGSVQSFCMYTGTAILFCYIYNITFFGAFLALNGRREESNRHWFTCRKVQYPDPDHKSNQCSVGGAYDAETGSEEEMPINILFRKYYGPFLTNPWTKVFVILLYSGYLASSIYGCFQMQEGIDLKNLAPDDSYVASYYEDEDTYFSDYGPSVMLVIKNETFQYWKKSSRDDLTKCLKQFESSDMVAKDMTVSWLQSYLNTYPHLDLDLDDKAVFLAELPDFLKQSGFWLDVNISSDKILASRIFILTVNINSAIKEKEMLNFFRKTSSNCNGNMDLVVYHPAFIYFDQYAVIVSNTIQNIVVATVVMLVISLLLIPHPLCSLWVTFAIASVIVGVAGFMALWDVNLDSISMINLVICIGFSVDFSAHISYAFVSSEKKTADEKAIDAIYHLGYPIVQGAVSTIAGVVVLSAAESYIFRTFFKIMFLVILFGALHGIMFIPTFLTFFGCCSDSSSVQGEKDQIGSEKNLGTNYTMQMPHRFTGHSHLNPYPYRFSYQNQSRSNYTNDPDCP